MNHADSPDVQACTLVLIRHAQPDVHPEVPAREWGLSPEGKAQAAQLAELLAPFNIAHVVGSEERKALETAYILAFHLRTTCAAADGLHEHERDVADYFDSREAFRERVRQLFAEPDRLVFGQETATAASDRFARAVEAVMHDGPARQNTAIVTHGTVMSLYVARITGQDPYTFWSELGFPGYVVVDWPARTLRQTVARPLEV
jgi:broad specificity phosphatase PhoE